MVKLQTSSTRIAPGVQLDRDVMVPLRDGVRMAANVFRPTASGRFPAILSVTPYAKDNLQDRLGTLMMRLSGVRFGTLNCSRWAGFESPDPHYWVNRGYIVAQADARGMHK